MTPIEWQTQEYDYLKKDTIWYLVVVGIGLLLILFALWQRNFLFAVFILFAVLTVIIWNKQKPRKIKCVLDEKGIKINNKFYDLEDFSGFDLFEGLLVLKKSGYLGRYLKIKITDNVGDKIKKQLQKKLSEVEYEESIIDIIGDYLGF